MSKVVLNRSHRAGRGRVSIETKSETIEVETDPAELGRPVAETIRDAIESGIRNTSATNKAGKRSWNRTGRLASGLTVNRSGDAYEIKAPSDRLQDPKMIEQLAEDVPVIAEPLQSAAVKDQIAETARDMVTINDRRLL